MADPIYRCPRCGHEEPFNPEDWRGGFIITLPDTSERPVCPHCIALFIKEFCGLMEPTHTPPQT